jgi:hypothetical protein
MCRQLNLSADLMLLEKAWEAEMGSLRTQARLAALDRTCLVIETISSTALQEISLRRKELIRRLNKHFAQPFIDQITVRMAAYG